MREILLEMYERLWETDKDKFAWHSILDDALKKIEVINQEPNEALMKAAEKYKSKQDFTMEEKDLNYLSGAVDTLPEKARVLLYKLIDQVVTH